MLRRGLTFAGYTVRMAADGETALRLALEQEPDLIVLDVMLPEPLDGLEVARRLRAGGSNVPILLLTARERPILIATRCTLTMSAAWQLHMRLRRVRSSSTRAPWSTGRRRRPSSVAGTTCPLIERLGI